MTFIHCRIVESAIYFYEAFRDKLSYIASDIIEIFQTIFVTVNIQLKEHVKRYRRQAVWMPEWVPEGLLPPNFKASLPFSPFCLSVPLSLIHYTNILVAKKK